MNWRSIEEKPTSEYVRHCLFKGVNSLRYRDGSNADFRLGEWARNRKPNHGSLSDDKQAGNMFIATHWCDLEECLIMPPAEPAGNEDEMLPLPELPRGPSMVAEVTGHRIADAGPSDVATPDVESVLAEALEIGVKWMEWWVSEELCECEGGHICGKTQRKAEIKQMRAALELRRKATP